MKIDIKKDDIFLLIDSLYSYQLDIEHGNDNGSPYVWTEDQVMSLVNKLTKFVEVKEKS
jgi:hypothetical protein